MRVDVRLVAEPSPHLRVWIAEVVDMTGPFPGGMMAAGLGSMSVRPSGWTASGASMAGLSW